MIVGLPSGIGDYSWAYSKLCSLPEVTGIEIADGWPYRTREYVELCFPQPRRAAMHVAYGQFNYRTIIMHCDTNGYITTPAESRGFTWKSLLANIGWDGLSDEDRKNIRVLIEPNRHLEAGKWLADWLPDLPTEFHYPLYTTLEDRARARDLIRRAVDEAPATRKFRWYGTVGVSCASYRGAEAWKTWGRGEWIDCLKRVMAEGWLPLLIGGSWDDLTYAVSCELELPNLVGKTSIGENIEVLRILPAYVGYSSGLNVIRTVIDKPAMALWPDFQQELSRSWAPRDMLESERYVAMLWRPVDDVWPVLRAFLRRCHDEAEKENGNAKEGLHSAAQENGDGQEARA